MENRILKSDLYLLITAIIWGFAFVAQRIGMEHVGPFTFNALRFGLGVLVLSIYLSLRKGNQSDYSNSPQNRKLLITGGLTAGLFCCVASTCQQIGLVYTTAGKAGFITGLYVVLVTIFGIIWKQFPGWGTWAGAGLSAIGLYLLSVTDQFTMAPGDGIVLAGAFFWAGHVLTIGRYSPKVDSIKLALIQFGFTCLVSLILALLFEELDLNALARTTIPVLYAGVMSVGIAYTLQVVGQKYSPPAHASIIMSLEVVFAAVGGWLILSEIMTGRILFGCILMLAGMILSQLFIRHHSGTVAR